MFDPWEFFHVVCHSFAGIVGLIIFWIEFLKTPNENEGKMQTYFIIGFFNIIAAVVFALLYAEGHINL